MTINKFEDLEIWQEARLLCRIVYECTSKEPFSKDYKFKSQIMDSSGSVMDNIAEGYERDGNREFIQFLSVAKGSCGETRSQSYRAFDYEYINQEQLNTLIEKTTKLSKSISGFIKYLRNSGFKGRKF